MKDNLEKFILDNREEFDLYEPAPGVWDRIGENMRPKRVINWKLVISRVAAVIIIFTASYFVHHFIYRLQERPVAAKDQKEPVIPELKEAEFYYSNLIRTKLEEIKPMLTGYPSLEQEINYDLNQLDSIYNDLKDDLKDNIANRDVIEAMIQNYRLRLTILEDVISMLKPEKNENNTKYNSHDL